MSTSNSYFGKIILLLVLSIGIFFVCKEKLPSRLFAEQTTVNSNMVIDSLLLEAVNDTLGVATTTKSVDGEVFIEEEVDESFNPLLTADGYQNLQSFYEKLDKLEHTKTGKVRIAYFGDSMNDGDYIVQDVRSLLQTKYGGQGVGFVAVTSLSANARGSVSHQYSKNWNTQSFLNVKKPTRAFGIDGQVFFPSNDGQANWVKYKAQSQKNATALNHPTLFYGSANTLGASIKIQADKDSATSQKLNPTHLLNTLKLSSYNPKSLQVNFLHADSIPIYGLNFDDGQGVHVDNFSMRGNSGLPLSILNASLMNAFDKELGYDLIILHYGTNVLNYGSLNYSWYTKNMTKVVNHLHQCFPHANILVVSTADKASKKEMEMLTDPAVVPLVNAQRNYARNTSSGFINLYQLMGGEGSMVKWVDTNLAGKDYTHFNAQGSRKIAGLIYGEIEKGYTKYKSTTLANE